MSSFAYSVAIKLSVANLASKGVRLLANDLLKAHGAATNLQDKLSALKMVAVGYGLDRAGQGILGFMGKSIEAAKDYTHQIALMNAAGFTQKELAESIGSAWKTTGTVITTTAAQNLETIRELRSAFGKGEGMEHAYAVLPQVQRVSSILASMTGKEQSHVGFDMVKAIELGSKGALTVESMMRQSEMMSKALVQFGNTLNVSDFHQALKMSRAMAPYMSDEFKYQYLPTLIQEMKTGPNGGASGAGNAIASLGQVVVGQMIPKALISNWIEAGLINPKMVVKDKHNRTTSKILPGGTAGQNEFGANPYLWAQKYAAPAVEKLMRLHHLDQYGAILSLTHSRVAAFALQTLINKGAQFERDRKLVAEGPSSYASYQQLLKKDPMMAEKALHNQWQNVLARIGFDILPIMIPYMIKFADGLDRISQWMVAHPDLTKGLVFGLVGLGVALSIIGKAMMLAGIIKFLGLGGALAGLGGAAMAALPWIALIAGAAFLIYRNWSSIYPWLVKIWTIIRAVWKVGTDDIIAQAKALWAVVGPVMRPIFFALSWIFNKIIKFVGSVVGGLINLGYGEARTILGEGGAPKPVPPPRPAAVPTAPKRGADGHMPAAVYLDGRKVGQLLYPHMQRDAGRPNNGTNGFNSGYGRPMPGMVKP
ncbi:MAG: hypothetical protein OC190_00200 [Novosphingobium aromaticivorans]|nr:hypothetical protein [Novosphingobium aromaticivorans]